MASFMVTVTCAAAFGTTVCPLTEPHSRQFAATEHSTCLTVADTAAELIRQFGFEPKNFRIKCEPLK